MVRYVRRFVQDFERRLAQNLSASAITNAKLSESETWTEFKDRLRLLYNKLQRGEQVWVTSQAKDFPTLAPYIPKRSSRKRSTTGKKKKSTSRKKTAKQRSATKKRSGNRNAALKRFIGELYKAIPDLRSRPTGTIIDEFEDNINRKRELSSKDIENLLDELHSDLSGSEEQRKVTNIIAKYDFMDRLWSNM